MSVEDWVHRRVEVFQRMTLLLELVQRRAAADGLAGEAAYPCPQRGPSSSSDVSVEDGSICALAEDAMQQLRCVTDDWVRMAALAIIFTPTVLAASAADPGTPQQVWPAGKPFWAQVTARLQFCDQQLRLLDASRRQLQRISRIGLESVREMHSQGACTALFEAVLLQQQQQQAAAGPGGACAGGTAAPPPPPPAAAGAGAVLPNAAATVQTTAGCAAAADGGDAFLRSNSSMSDSSSSNSSSTSGTEAGVQALGRHVDYILLALQCHNYFMTSTMSPLQRVLMFVAAFPYYPLPSMISECAAELYEQRKQQQQQQEEGVAEDNESAAPGATRTLMQQMVAEDAQQHLQQRSIVLLQQLQAWGLD
jgi:hypothetical protein